MTGTSRPAPPSPLPGPAGALRARFGGGVEVPGAVVDRLAGVCASLDTGLDARVAAGRDWWPLGVAWAAAGTVPAVPAVVARPASAAEVADVLVVCRDARIPVTPVAGRSGVCGGSVPVFGGVSLDLTAMAGIVDVDDADLLVEIAPGTWGDDAESQLRAGSGLTIGHWPQSMAISTVGGWVACRGAGQYSTRYGKIEDIVTGLEVVLADGSVLRTGGRAPRRATGPDLTGLFVGSEGTLGVITSVGLRVHPLPETEQAAAWSFAGFAEGLGACRRILRRGATPAVLRLYDTAESARAFPGTVGCVLVVVDEGDAAIVGATMAVVTAECAAGEPLGDGPARRWLAQRNEVPSLGDLAAVGIVADTVEVAGPWRSLGPLHEEATAALLAVPGTLVASGHQSHAYPDGACLYFTFAGRPGDASVADPGIAGRYYAAAWDAVMAVTLRHGAAVSHHHGIGLNRGRYLAGSLGAGWSVLRALKDALDPVGILNPGKLGLPSPFGEAPWPAADPPASPAGEG